MNRGKRKIKKRSEDIAQDVARRYPSYTKYSSSSREERIAKELEQHKKRQNLDRAKERDRNRLVSDAIAIVEEELRRLASLEREPDMPKKGTKAYKDLLKREKNMAEIVAQRNARLNAQSASEAIKRRQRHLEYQQKAKEMIENVAVKEIRKLLSQEHITALQGHEELEKLRGLLDPIVAVALQNADSEEKLECSFCDSVHPSNRLRVEHTQSNHFTQFLAKAMDFLALLM